MLLGHAAFEFIEARYGKESIRQFPFELRRDVVDGTGDLYQAAFNMAPDEFDAAFEQYLRERFANTR
jgi:cation transport regulator ChaB